MFLYSFKKRSHPSTVIVLRFWTWSTLILFILAPSVVDQLLCLESWLCLTHFGSNFIWWTDGLRFDSSRTLWSTEVVMVHSMWTHLAVVTKCLLQCILGKQLFCLIVPDVLWLLHLKLDQQKLCCFKGEEFLLQSSKQAVVQSVLSLSCCEL